MRKKTLVVFLIVIIGIFLISEPKQEPNQDQWLEITPQFYLGTNDPVKAVGQGDGTENSYIEVYSTTYIKLQVSSAKNTSYDFYALFMVPDALNGFAALDPSINFAILEASNITSGFFPTTAVWGIILNSSNSNSSVVTGQWSNFVLKAADIVYKSPFRLYLVLLNTQTQVLDRKAFIFSYEITVRSRDWLDLQVSSWFDRQPTKSIIGICKQFFSAIGLSTEIQDIFFKFINLIGFVHLSTGQLIMILVGLILIYLAIAKEIEPVLLLPIGFGSILVNIPLSGLMDIYNEEGLLYVLYAAGILTELFPILIFIGIGAMMDFGPLLERPKMLIFGAAGQFGIFFTLLVALLLQSLGILPVLRLGFALKEASSIAIVGAADGPSAIYLTASFAPHLLGPVVVAAYSYMALVPIIQKPIMKMVTTKKERAIRMEFTRKYVPPRTKIMFPLLVTLITGLIAPLATPLIGALMLGNLLKEAGVVERLRQAAENEIPNVVTLLLGISVGATMTAQAFLTIQTLIILLLGVFAFISATVAGLLLGKFYCWSSGGKINPLIGACGISAFPMSARVAASVALEEDANNFIIFHAMASNTGGQIGSVIATGMLLLLVPYLAPFIG